MLILSCLWRVYKEHIVCLSISESRNKRFNTKQPRIFQLTFRISKCYYFLCVDRLFYSIFEPSPCVVAFRRLSSHFHISQQVFSSFRFEIILVFSYCSHHVNKVRHMDVLLDCRLTSPHEWIVQFLFTNC